MRDPRSMTLIESLRAAALRSDRGIQVVEGREQLSYQSYAQVVTRAESVAAGLQQAGLVRGDRVGLILPSPADFLPTFYGIQMAGGVPAPIYPPPSLSKLDGFFEATSHILKVASARFVVTDDKLAPLCGPLQAKVPGLEKVFFHGELQVGADLFRTVDVKLDDLAFLQFTSGSTSAPKGVRLTHRCLQANVHVIRRFGVGLNDEDVPVSWLPLYHDMGLIGFHFTPLVQQLTVTYMTPVQFIMRPREWLRLMSVLGGTISFAPNFGYGYTAKRVKDAEVEQLDLSRWRIAGCGAEPIQEATLRTFCDKFRAARFNHRVLVPCFGLAEFSLAATFTPMTRGVVVDYVDADRLANEGRAVTVEKEKGVGFVACGFAVPGHTVEIVDKEGNPLPERHVGEIRLRGPSRAQGYEGIPEGVLGFRDGYLYTGDRGYLSGCELYVCGRDKEIIKSRGRTYYPQDIEWAAGQVEGVRFGTAAAFGAPTLETEEVVVVIERRPGGVTDAQLKGQVIRTVGDSVGILVDRVVIAPPGSVTKTSSGKIQRARIRQAYLDGQLGAEAPAGDETGPQWNKLWSPGDGE